MTLCLFRKSLHPLSTPKWSLFCWTIIPQEGMDSKTLFIIVKKRTRIQTRIKIAIYKMFLRLHIHFYRRPVIVTWGICVVVQSPGCVQLLQPHGWQHTRLCLTISQACPSSHPLHRWCQASSGYSLVAHIVKPLPAMQETWVRSLVGKIPWRRKWQPTPVFLPGESHGRRSLVGYSTELHMWVLPAWDYFNIHLSSWAVQNIQGAGGNQKHKCGEDTFMVTSSRTLWGSP